ncbi:recombination protein NinG [Pseudomonas sp. FP1740]|uniref:recombination protein NinG n=1 Tax=Pseudomonas sp. FP1740 TaxID=2954078 RepID=UPI00273686C7|nr:recombination protein NinG [Pseudomonas sp. FP1740]WLG43259.1 recombination protein NinG [Pseudomonas sp. FP1740]
MSLSAKQPRPKKCRVAECGASFVPARLGQAVCSPACAILDAPKNLEKARKALADVGRKELQAAKERIKPKGQYMKEAQAVINRYVRLRDARLGCISCDKSASWPGQWHCSHFRSVGAAPHLRFNLWNMNRSCSVCNNHLSGNIGAYKPALVEKIGQAKVDWLESHHARAGHDIEYLKRLKRIFSKKCRILEGRLSCNAA